MKGNIFFYLLMKYVSLLTSRFSAICLWPNSCHMGICWHDCSRIQPDVDVSKNATCTICRGWMAAGYQMKGNIVFYLLMKYFSLLTSRLSHNMSLTKVLSFGGCVDMVVQEYILISMFPRTPYAQSAAAEWLRGIKWRAILLSICWWNICYF